MKFLWKLTFRVAIATVAVLATVYAQPLAGNFLKFYIGVVCVVSLFVIASKPSPKEIASYLGSPVRLKIGQVIRRIWIVSLIILMATYGWFWCAIGFIVMALFTEIWDKKVKDAGVLKPKATIDI